MNEGFFSEIKLDNLAEATEDVRDSYATILTYSCYYGLGATNDSILILANVADLITRVLKLFDDVIDNDIDVAYWHARSKYINTDDKVRGSLVNLGTVLFAKAGELLSNLHHRDFIPPQVVAKIQGETFKNIVPVVEGQQASILVENPTLESAVQIAEMKSGCFYGLVCWNAAYFAKFDEDLAHKFFEFGKLFGMIVQIANDMSDIWSHEGNPSDLKQGVWSLPIAYSMSVLAAEERTILESSLFAARNSEEAEKKARDMLIKSGAFVYWQIENQVRINRAKTMLKTLIPNGKEREKLIHLMERLITVTPK
ncbi:MAG: polyprenyl synthetase family protein [Chloroflexota bacterium]